MNQFKKLNNIIGWIIFAIATAVYMSTLEPTASWWDCGEYIATAYKLQVGHPPGAPLFQMLGRFFSLFTSNPEHVAFMVNTMSGLSSAFTILFLFWSITMLAKKIYVKSPEDTLTKGQMWAVLGAGMVGSLAYTFTDSFWFSAVEGEVYAMSSFFTAVVFWAILKWEEVADKSAGYRWILLIAYLTGLAIGVHLLNLLAIPAIVYVFYFKKYKFSWKGFIYAGLIAVGILSLIMYVIIPWVVNLAGQTELFFVNTIGLPFNSGTIIYFLVLIGLIVWGLIYTRKKGKTVWNTAILSVVLILIGYSSFFMLIIRANANPPINENDPKDALGMLSYLNREQYGTWPLLYGQYYNAPIVGREDGTPVYKKDKKLGKYVVKDDRKGTIPVYDPRFMTIFPRMWSSQKPSHIKLYKQYGGTKGIPIKVQQEDGSYKTLYKPTFWENLKFFFTYQLDHMYIRYFMWNFVGRQNNIESQGEIDHGNWISGINFIDKMRLGDQSDLPKSMQNPARARFYFLPLILGLIGFFFHLGRSKKDTWVVFMLFFMTGIAIIIYLNQTPMQPRERDYAYAGSFYAFAMWIGIGVLSLYEAARKVIKKETVAAVAVTVVSLLLVPTVMAKEGWHAHDRSGKYAARDFARMYLESCAPNAILFTNGDNDTFPLWYAQEVEGIRTDVRVVNYMLASGDWYAKQMFRKVYDSDPLPLTIPKDKYDSGDYNYLPVYPMIKGDVELKDAINFIADDDPRSKMPLQNGQQIDYMPTKTLVLTIDSAAVVNSGTVAPEDAGKIVKQIKWKIKQNGLFRSDILLLDLIANNNWKRPIYFANPNSVSKVLDVDKYCHMEGVVYRFKPVLAMDYIRRVGGVDAERSYEILTNDSVRWGRLNEPDVNVDRESFRNATIAKQSYIRTAQALTELNKKEASTKVLDKGIEFFPPEKFPFDYFTTHWAMLYYRNGETEKANKVVQEIFDRYMDDLRYYNSLDNKFLDYYSEDIREALTTLQQLAQLAKDNGQKELGDKLDKAFKDQLGLLK